MRNLTIFFFCVMAVFIQLSVFGVFFSQSRMPDLLIALSVTLIVAGSFEKSAGWIAFSGILLDSGTTYPVGTSAILYVFVALSVSALAGISDIRSRKTMIVFSVFALAAFSLFLKDILIIAGLFSKTYLAKETFFVPIDFFSPDYVFKTVYTALSTGVAYYLFRRLSRALFLEPIVLAKKSRF